MNGPWAGVEGNATTVLVFEYVTGGGLVGLDLPPSWAAEGSAMRRAIAADFAAVPGVRVVMTVDPRLDEEPPAGVEARLVEESSIEGLIPGWFPKLVAEVDHTLLIAPESDGILARWTGAVAHFGGRSLGSSEETVRLTGDKFRLWRHFEQNAIPTPPTWTLESRLFDLGGEWSGPLIVKPRFGAGSVETAVVRDRQCPPWARPRRDFVAQPYRSGVPMSASFLVDASGQASLVGVASQRIDRDDAGRISYRGGSIDPRLQECPAVVARAVDSVTNDARKPSLQGFVGVDFLRDERGEATVLEINPRPTTSYVGLAHLYPPGTIAGAWLAAAAGPLAAIEWPDRLRINADQPLLSFDADGTIRLGPGADDQ
jgi:predicted ATP-grasp superfamily ATP-dependent carboligase